MFLQQINTHIIFQSVERCLHFHTLRAPQRTAVSFRENEFDTPWLTHVVLHCARTIISTPYKKYIFLLWLLHFLFVYFKNIY